MYAHVYLLYINIIKFEIYIRLNQPCINTAFFASVMSAVPSPSEVCEMLESCLKTNPLNQLLVSALKEVKKYDDYLTKIHEEGHVYYSAEVHEQVMAQEQEEWKKWYKEYLLKYVPELQPTTPQKVEEQ